jgi:DNA replication protein DnaC
MMINQTSEKLRAMRLPAMATEYLKQSESPEMSALDFDERIGMMVDAEWLSRENNRIQKLSKAANLRFSNTCFADIDYRPSRKLERATIARLSDFTWVKEAKNMIITGATGCGKTWLACAFGQEACHKGFSVAFYRVNRLLIEIAQNSDPASQNKLLKSLKKIDILILDDWGLSNLNTIEGRFLLEVFEDRYNISSTILSAQVPVPKWHELFEDSTIADAVLDRVVHNAHRIALHGHSLRAAADKTNRSHQAPDGAQDQNTHSLHDKTSTDKDDEL